MPGGVVVDATGGLLKGRHSIFVQHLKSSCPVMPYHRFGIFFDPVSCRSFLYPYQVPATPSVPPLLSHRPEGLPLPRCLRLRAPSPRGRAQPTNTG